MRSSAEFYKKLLIIALLVIGGVLVSTLEDVKAATTYQCFCAYSQGTVTADNYNAAQSYCRTQCADLGGFVSLQPISEESSTCDFCCCTDGSTNSGAGISCYDSCLSHDGIQSSQTYDCASPPASPPTCVAGGQSCPSGYQWNPNAETEEGVPGACEPTGTGETEDNEEYNYDVCIADCDPNDEDCIADCAELLSGTGGGGTGGSTGGGGTGGGRYELPNPLGVTSISALITKIAKFLIALAIPFAVFMVILAGFRFATAQGNEEKLTKAKQNFIWTIAGVAIILASEALIIYIEELLGAGGGGTVNAFINKIRQTLNSVVVILFILVTIYFGWGVIQYVVGSRGDEEKLTQGKRHMIWGIVGMTVMASAWGIVSIISAYLR